MPRVVLVTGASRGIGSAIAEAFLRGGHKVAITARAMRALTDASAGRESGDRVHAIAADLADAGAPSRIMASVVERWGHVDILVNNAGIGSGPVPRPVVEMDDDTWELAMRVNVGAPFRLIRQVLPGMLERGWGRIINVASLYGKTAAPNTAAYTASKHALLGLTKVTALEVAARGVTVNAICPGMVHTAMQQLRLERESRRLNVPMDELARQGSPLERPLEPSEIASTAEFLASNGAAAINGQSFNVCGGSLLL